MMRAWRSIPLRQRVAWALALLLALLTLALLLNRVARQAIAMPLAYAGWIAGQLLKSVPQMIIWGWLLLVVVTLALLAFRSPKPPAENFSAGARRQKQERIAFWAMQVGMARRGAYYRARFAEFFTKIIWGVLAYHRRGSTAAAERDYRASLLQMPDPLKPFLASRANLENEEPPRGCRAALGWLNALLPPLRRNGRAGSGSSAERDRELERAVTYLEQQLEVKHERRSE